MARIEYCKAKDPDPESNHVEKQEPVAVVGMSCRLPGDLNSTSELWDFLNRGQCAISKVPECRFNGSSFQHPDAQEPCATHGYFIQKDVREFDNEFFGINSLEATYMDPQQRQLLEVAFECFEDAGLRLEDLDGRDIGSFVGNFTDDFTIIQSKDIGMFHRYTATGMGHTMLSNRISHVFNLRGPSFTVDTACSASMHSVHLACKALQSQECEGALVAGVNLIQSPEVSVAEAKAGILSPSGTCNAFSADADGYGRGEAVGALFLKRLSDAVQSGDHIRCVIRSTATNSNGRTHGIAHPNPDAQVQVIRKAYERAGLSTNDTHYVECHGTGTAVGDPLEIQALAQTFGDRVDRPLLVGSVKNNLGHSEGASAITSIIKVALALEHEVIPQSIGVAPLHPILREKRNIMVAERTIPWPDTGTPRAGVNSFGYGGSNSHCILESAKHIRATYNQQPANWPMDRVAILPFSAGSRTALQSRVEDLKASIAHGIQLADLCYTLGCRRSMMSVRGFVLAREMSLESDLQSQKLLSLPNEVKPSRLPLALVFTGQGAQWLQMGKDLFNDFPLFRQTIARLDAYLCTTLSPPVWTIQETLIDSTERIHEVSRCQPVCTALQIALVDLLKSWGIKHSRVVGHSSGEIAASYGAGYLDARQAILCAYYRGLVVSKGVARGAMLAVGLSATAAETEIRRHPEAIGKIKVACINSPESVTISGDADMIDSFANTLQSRGIFNRLLKTNGNAYHSHHMLAIGEAYANILRAFLDNSSGDHRPELDAPMMISSVTGQPITGHTALKSSYWQSNLEMPVLFESAVETLIKKQDYHFIEIGPHSALEMPIRQTYTKLHPGHAKMLYSSLISRNKNSSESLLKAIGSLYQHRHPIDFSKVNRVDSAASALLKGSTSGNFILGLAPYRWNHENLLWSESRLSSELRQRRNPSHELIGSLVSGGDGKIYKWRNILRESEVSWLKDHKLGDSTIFPGAGYLAMAIEAFWQICGHDNSTHICMRNVKFSKMLDFSEISDFVELFITLRRQVLSASVVSSSWWEFEISSLHNDASKTHSSGLIRGEDRVDQIPSKLDNQSHLRAERADKCYTRFEEVGLVFGPAFRTLSQVNFAKSRGQHIARCEASSCSTGLATTSRKRYLLHPATLDAMMQTCLLSTSAGKMGDLNCKVPVSVEAVTLNVARCSEAHHWTIDANAERVGMETFILDGRSFDDGEELGFEFKGIRAPGCRTSRQQKVQQEQRPMLRKRWLPDPFLANREQLRALKAYLLNNSKSAGTVEGLVELARQCRPNASILDFPGDLRELKKEMQIARDKNEEYDMILCSPYAGPSLQHDSVALMRHPIQPRTVMFTLFSPRDYVKYMNEGFELISSDVSEPDVVDKHLSVNGYVHAEKHDVFLITGEGPTDTEKIIIQTLNEELVFNIIHITADSILALDIPPRSTFIVTWELASARLKDLTFEELQALQLVTDKAERLLWITKGTNSSFVEPDTGLVRGWARALAIEQPSMKLITLRVNEPKTAAEVTGRNIKELLKLTWENAIEDKDFTQQEGAIFVSRYITADHLNERLPRQQGQAVTKVPQRDAEWYRLAIDNPGQFDTLKFVPSPAHSKLPPGYVQVASKCIGLNAKDLYVLSDKVDVKNSTTAHEFAGVITKLGEGVTEFKVGDRVLTMAPGYFSNYQQVPASCCVQLRDYESFAEASALPVVCASALYALHDRANIQDGESVLIHSATSGLGQAAIQVARIHNAVIFATVGSDAKKQHLVDAYGLPESHIFSSRNSDFVDKIHQATDGNGVDIVINTLTGELLHDTWRALASFGRFIELGKHDIVDHGKLDMSGFRKDATFSAFDLTDLFYSSNPRYQKKSTSLLQQTMALWREGKMRAATPVAQFDVGDVRDAFRHLSSRARTGKIVVSFENDDTMIDVVGNKYQTKFNSSKSYIMVGCLGGLGRSLSRWMQGQGARNFVFLGRSGTDKVESASLVAELEAAGATVEVIKGNVSSGEDVERAVSTAAQQAPIGGVIQAAMGLSESVFSGMSHESWITAIRPKVHGTWNLHNALRKRKRDSLLDVFFMTSSITAAVGSATESNYCAANSFLDSFAQYRQAQGLPATALALGLISGVGYVAENPEIEAVLQRKQLRPINEDELLHLVDVAMSEDPRTKANDLNDGALYEPGILTGWESTAGDSNPVIANDPRFSLVASQHASKTSRSPAGALPKDVQEAVDQDGSLLDAIRAFIAEKVCKLILLPMEKLDQSKPLGEFGMDSMLASELRMVLFDAFEVDVPFGTFLSERGSTEALAEMVAEEIRAKQASA